MKATVIYQAGATTYNFPFDYLGKQYVKALYQHTDGTSTDLTYNIDYSIVDKQLILKVAGESIDRIRIYRETPTTHIVNFVDASILRAKDLNMLDVQLLHLSEEASDKLEEGGMSLSDVDNKWDAKQHGIKHLLPGTEDQDAATFGQVKAIAGAESAAAASAASALSSATAAATSERVTASHQADAADNARYAHTEAVAAEGNATAAAQSATAAATSEQNVVTTITNSATAIASQVAAQATTNASARSETAATKAEDAAVRAAASATAAAQSATAASEDAVKTAADRAEVERIAAGFTPGDLDNYYNKTESDARYAKAADVELFPQLFVTQATYTTDKTQTDTAISTTKTTADTAKTTADTAKTTADAAKTAADTANTDLVTVKSDVSALKTAVDKAWNIQYVLAKPALGTVSGQFILPRDCTLKRIKVLPEGVPTVSTTIHMYRGNSVVLTESLAADVIDVPFTGTLATTVTPFKIMIGMEVMEVTAINGNSLLVNRGQLGTKPVVHSAGALLLEEFHATAISSEAPITETQDILFNNNDVLGLSVEGAGLAASTITVELRWRDR